MTRFLVLLAAVVLAPLAALDAQKSNPAAAPKKLLLISSPADDHAPTTHEYTAGLNVLAKCLKPVPGLEVTSTSAAGPWREGPELLGRADTAVIFLTEGAKWLSADEKRLAAFRQLAARKGGLVVIHWGMGTKEAEPIEAFVNLFGGCHGGPDRSHKVVDAAVTIPEPRHPIATGLKPFTVKEEFYYKLKTPKGATIQPVVHATIDGNNETVAWAWERPDGGRSFGFSGLHFHEHWKLEDYRRLVAQGTLWVAGLPVPEKGLAVDLPESAYLLEKK